MKGFCYRMLHSKRFWITTGVLILLYVFIANRLGPSVQVIVPKTAAYRQDMEIEVMVSAWHSRFQVVTVAFTTFRESTAVTEDAATGAVLYATEGPQKLWHFCNPFTLPTRKRLTVTVPFKKLAEEGAIQAGVLKGRVSVVVDHGLMEWSIMVSEREKFKLPISLTLRP